MGINPHIANSNWWKSLSVEKRRAFEAAAKPYDDKPAITANSKTIQQIDTSGRVVAVYTSCSEASRKTGINQGNISSVCHGRLKQTGGYRWRYST